MIDFGGVSEIGPVCADNQDAFYLHGDNSEQPGVSPIIILADGMGGHAYGGVASGAALKALLDAYTQFSLGTPDRALKRGFDAANEAVRSEAARLDVNHIGTTLTAAVIHGNVLHIAHIGDSRAYLVRNGKATCLTEDHTVVGDLLRMKVIQGWQVRTHARRSILTKAIGLTLFAQPDIFSTNLFPGDRVVLCTDGCWALLEDDEIARISSSAAGAEELCRKLVDVALEHGSDDNVSAVAAHVRQIPHRPQYERARGGWMGRLFGSQPR